MLLLDNARIQHKNTYTYPLVNFKQVALEVANLSLTGVGRQRSDIDNMP